MALAQNFGEGQRAIIAMTPFPKLSFACPIPWSSLRGDEKARFCEKCGRTITNLSELSTEARAALLAQADGKELCITYYRRLSGEFVTPENPLTPDERSRIKQLGVAALSAGAMALAAGCMSKSVPAAPPKEVRQQPVPTQTKAADSEVIMLQAFGVMATPPSKRK